MQGASPNILRRAFPYVFSASHAMYVRPKRFSIDSCVPLQESNRTLRDGSFRAGSPRHFVPVYDRIVPPGHFKQASARDEKRI